VKREFSSIREHHDGSSFTAQDKAMSSPYTTRPHQLNSLLQHVIVQENEIDNEIEVVLLEALLNDSDEESTWGGSRPGKSHNKERDFQGAYEQLTRDYFSGDSSIYDEQDFNRRFRMPRSVFQKIHDEIVGRGSFRQRHDCTGKVGINPLCRLTAVLRMIAYGDAADHQDEYLRISETSTMDSLKEFNRFMVESFGEEYLCRNPTEEERQRILHLNQQRLFPGMFASWDCKHFPWKNCPVQFAGQHDGHAEGKTLILEAIADLDLYCWYIHFGEAGTLNDTNVFDKSSIVASILDGSFDLKCEDYIINGHVRNWMYFLADGIYPPWAIFVLSIRSPILPIEALFARIQEGDRKDVERFFGVLVARFHILERPIRMWYMKDIYNLLYSCVIMHNMIVKDRRSLHPDEAVGPWLEQAAAQFRNEHESVAEINNRQQQHDDDDNAWSLFGCTANDTAGNAAVGEMLAARVATVSQNVENQEEHYRLKNDLMMHIWQHLSA
jgi:hypothetical protein